MKTHKDYTTIHFVATPEMKAWIEARARESERTVSQYMRVLLKEIMEPRPAATPEREAR